MKIPEINLKLKTMRIINKYLQKFADYVVDKIKTTETLKGVEVWFNIGMNVNTWLVEKNIWLK